MAFVLDQQWSTAGGAPARNARAGADVGLALLPASLRRRVLGLALTAIVHAILLVLLILNVFGRQEVLPRKVGSEIHLIDLQPFQGKEADQPAEAESKPQAKPQEATKTDTTAVEWSQSKLLVAEAEPAPPSPPIIVPSANNGQSTGGGGGGGDVYDPYAGAAPLRSGAFVRASTEQKAQGQLAALAMRITDLLHFRQPTLHGTLSLRVTISTDGRIAAARQVGGSLTRSAQPQITAALIGQMVGGVGNGGLSEWDVGPLILI